MIFPKLWPRLRTQAYDKPQTKSTSPYDIFIYVGKFTTRLHGVNFFTIIDL